MSNTPEYVTVRVRDLQLSAKNARKKVNPRTIRELAASIKHQGLLTPLLIAEVPGKGKKPGHYEILDGGRRWRAMQ